MINITEQIELKDSEVKFTFIRAPGPGGQNVNKLATGVVLRFNVINSSLPNDIRERLLLQLVSKLTKEGDLIIKAIRHRTQERNKLDAVERLGTIIKQAIVPPKKRKKTEPSYSSVQRRLSTKKLHSKNKSLRGGKFHNHE